MKKIKLILQPDQFTSFTSYYLEEFWNRFFDIEIYQDNKTYDRSGTVFAFWWMNANDALAAKLKDQGHHVAIDHLWEYPEHRTDFFWIEHPDWFRLNESLWWRAMGYHHYHADRNTSYLAFMPMNQPRSFRELLFKKMQPLLDRCIWSYRNQNLPGDTDRTHGEWQRFMNPDWYNQTHCSIVAETYVDRIWPTEKSMKPIAYYHPFLILSQCGHLKYLRTQGFETFDNIFDESYDDVADTDTRCQRIVDNVLSIEIGNYDSETQRRLKHNHDHFFDQTLVESIIEKEIVDPLLEYAAT